jgi:acyl-CoA synthetase (AMP-forming)/AMP-acid ligase II
VQNERQIASDASELMFRVRAFISASKSAVDDSAFNEIALAVFNFQFRSVPIYRQLCERRRVAPESVQHWEQIPALPVAAFKEHTVSSIPESERARVFHSSGTTAKIPSRHFHNAASLALYEASLMPWFERHFPGDGGLPIFLTPPSSQVAHSSLVHMFETIEKKLGAGKPMFLGQVDPDGSWTMNLERIESLLHLLTEEERVATLFGTAFLFVHLLDHLDAKQLRFRLPANSRVMETGGYKGRSRTIEKTELRRLITKFLNVTDSQIVTEYGMSELSSQAYDKIAGQNDPMRRYQFPLWVRTQIISPETGRPADTGEAGLLRIFDTANVCSVMAIQTEDLALETESGFELLGRAESAEARGCSLMAAT